MGDIGLALNALEAAAAAARAVTEIAAAARDTTVARSSTLKLFRRLRGEYPGDTRLQVLYWEVLYNAFILRQGQRLRPSALLVTTDEWRREGTAVALTKLGPVEIAAVSGAYAQVEMYRWYFGRSYMALFTDRLEGGDQKLLQTLGGLFLKAEEVLRPKAFSSRDLPNVAAAVENDWKLAEVEPIKPRVARFHGALLGGRDTEQVVYLTLIGALPILAGWRIGVRSVEVWHWWRKRTSGSSRSLFR